MVVNICSKSRRCMGSNFLRAEMYGHKGSVSSFLACASSFLMASVLLFSCLCKFFLNTRNLGFQSFYVRGGKDHLSD